MTRLENQQANVLDGLRESYKALRRNEKEIARRVAAAREYGVSWSRIGDVLGITKQAAWERYGRDDPHPGRNQPPAED